MNRVNLLLDIGNSRLKWAWSDGAQLSRYGVRIRDENFFTELAAEWQSWPRPERIIASNVAGDAFAQSLSRWLMEYWQVGVEYVTVEQGRQGLEIAYPQPQLFGIDRWLALIAARRLHPGAVCVIDCGTAVTIDAVDAAGRHRGGVIVPGLTLMQQSLLQRSEGVSRGLGPVADVEHSLLGCDTRSGVELGALYAVTGAIEHALVRIKAEMIQPITSIITGGDAEKIVAETTADCLHEPHLVLQGLQGLVDR